MEDTIINVITSTMKSLTLRQILFKLQTIKYVWNTTAKMAPSMGESVFRKPGYCLFYFICMVALAADSLLGIFTAIVLYQNPSYISGISNCVSGWTLFYIDLVSTSVKWLMGVPGGLKLNNELDHFLGTCFLNMTTLWRELYKEILNVYLDTWLYVIIFVSPFGLAMMLSLVHDILKFTTICITCLYISSAKLYSYQISALMSLSRLFMGRKYNVLKKRIDLCNYDASQLLLGTILFTILLFLLPTTAMYYFILLLLRLSSGFLQVAIKIAIIMINKIFLIAPQAKRSLGLLHLSASKLHVRDGYCVWIGKRINMKEFKKYLDSVPIGELMYEYHVGGKACDEDYIRIVHPCMITVVSVNILDFVLKFVLAVINGSVISL